MRKILKNFSIFLDKRQKSRLAIIAVMMVIGAGLECIGVSLILPLVNAILDPDFFSTDKYAVLVCKIFDLHSAQTFVIIVIAALIVLYIVKNAFLFLEYYAQYCFVCNNRFATQSKLFNIYIHKPYTYFLNTKSSDILRTIMTDTANAFQLLITVLSFFTELVVSIALVIYIFTVEPTMAALISIVLLIIVLLVNKCVKPILKRAGESLQKHSSGAYQWVLQAVSGIKEIKIAQRENFFLEMFSVHGKKAADVEKTNSVIGSLPRLLIETLTIGASLGVVAILLFLGRDVNTLLPQITAFAFAAVRLLPSANRMSAYLNSFSYYEPFLDNITSIFQSIKRNENVETEISIPNSKATAGQMTLNKQCELSNVTYQYPGAVCEVLKNVNMVIPIGKSVGIVGPSGAGKTTSVDILLGLLEPKSGKVLSDGIDITKNYSSWLSHVAYIPQMIYLLDDTVRSNVAFGFSIEEVDDEQVWHAIEEAQLADFIKSLPDGLDTMIGERGIRLSGGQRQRIGIARALYTDPELLILDEATSSLDNETEAAIIESINTLHGKKTLVIIAHRLTTIQGCDMIYRVSDTTIEIS